MSTVNPLSREISAKIVYYGPGLSGKTTSLQRVYDYVRPQSRGQLISLNTEGDRTLFFDFLPLHVEQVRGLSLRLQLYTVPGQVFYDATRKLVLNGADGVVFVADSQPAAQDRNLESMQNLRENLAELGLELDGFPLVLEYNKRDLPNVMPVEQLRRELNPRGVPEFETIAERGVNIMPALKEITRLVMVDLRARQPAPRRVEAPIEEKGSGGNELADRVSAAAEAAPPRSTPWPALTPRPGTLPAVALPRSPPTPARPVASATAASASAKPHVSDGATPLEISFARLFPRRARSVVEVEEAIHERTFGAAVRRAAEALAELLEQAFPPDDQPADRAALLGLDSRDYLKLSLLAAKPDPAVREEDALFALHLLVSAMFKADRL